MQQDKVDVYKVFLDIDRESFNNVLKARKYLSSIDLGVIAKQINKSGFNYKNYLEINNVFSSILVKMKVEDVCSFLIYYIEHIVSYGMSTKDLIWKDFYMVVFSLLKNYIGSTGGYS